MAATNANPGPDTIEFAHGLSGTIKLTSGELLISDSVTIDGPSAKHLAVSGNNASRVIEIATGFDVTISGLTITHGYAADLGGGILNNGSNLTLTGDDLTHNVVFESTTDGARGGALESLGGVLTIADCQITNNQSLGAAGASAYGDAYGGGISIHAGSATMSKTTISSNLARGGDNSGDGFSGGGGVSSNPALTITGCTISDNLARGRQRARKLRHWWRP